jgi:3-oxoacyl-[acyl-carrier protein] reductase
LEIPASVKVEGEITAWHQEMNSGMLRVTIIERDTHKITAIISLNFTLHGEKHQADVSVKETAITSVLQEETPCVIVTGAAGGIGANIVEHLLDRYRVLAIVNRQQMPEQIQTNQNLQVTKADLNDPNGYARIEEALLKENLYAIIHLACPPPLPGGLLSVNREALQAQFEFGSVHLIRLACLLNDHAKDGGRLVALGSDWGERRPKLNLASYSLGKSALEQTVKLLAPELAPKGISVNAICPNMLPLGMNVQINSRQLKIAESQIPAGRLCNTTDILSTVDWLLSSGSEYFSGQSVNLTGGSI